MPSQLWLKFDKIVCYLQILNEALRILSRRGLGTREIDFRTSLLAVKCHRQELVKTTYLFDLKDLISTLQKLHKFSTTLTILCVFHLGLLRRAMRYPMILKSTTPSFKDGEMFFRYSLPKDVHC